MNLLMRTFVFSLLVSRALAGVAFSSGDFSHAEATQRDGKTLLKLTLNSKGLVKMTDLNRTSLGQKTEFVLAGKTYGWVLREPIKGTNFEAGPVTAEEAQAIAKDVNQQH